MRAGSEAEAPDRPLDQRRTVLGHDAEVIAGAIAHAIGQQDLDVARAAARHCRVLQFAIGKDLHRQGMAAADDRVHRRPVDRPNLVERLLRGAVVGVELDAELVRDGRQHRPVPVLEVAIEVFLRIALAAGIKPLGSPGRHQLVDLARDRLIRRGPVAVATAEHGVAHTGERTGCGSLQALQELDGIVRGAAIVGGADDGDGALCRQLARHVV